MDFYLLGKHFFNTLSKVHKVYNKTNVFWIYSFKYQRIHIIMSWLISSKLTLAMREPVCSLPYSSVMNNSLIVRFIFLISAHFKKVNLIYLLVLGTVEESKSFPIEVFWIHGFGTVLSKAVENGMYCAVNMLRSFTKLKSSVNY